MKSVLFAAALVLTLSLTQSPPAQASCPVGLYEPFVLEWAVETPSGEAREWHEQWRPTGEATWHVVVRDESGALVEARELICEAGALRLVTEYSAVHGVVRVYEPGVPVWSDATRDSSGRVSLATAEGERLAVLPYTAVTRPQASVLIREYGRGGEVNRLTQVDEIFDGGGYWVPSGRVRLASDSLSDRLWVMTVVERRRLAVVEEWPLGTRK